MAKERLTISVDPASELARTLAGGDEPVALDCGGMRHTAEREDVFARYDARALLRGLRQSRGALSGVNIEELLADLDEQRSQNLSSRPR
jgi:hypothetical protein